MDLSNKGFQLPESVVFDSDSLTNTYGKYSAEPFERGFGTTLGNSIRRVMLASLKGAAVTSIRIPGILHEFTSMTGVEEDIVDVVLNVKQLSVKLLSGTSKIVTVNVKGPAVVTGKDISDAQVEVLNPDQHIATLEKDVDFTIDLMISSGKGYITAELNKDEDQTVDTIAIDSIFSPINKVNFWVENARVGRSTDYDKLIMEIWTDGTVTPQDALNESVGILMGHLAVFSPDSEKNIVEESDMQLDDNMDEHIESPMEHSLEGNPMHSIMDDFEDEPMEINDNLLKNVEELELSVRSYNCLKNANIRTLADLVQRTEQEMLRTKNFGRKSLNEIKEIIVGMGLQFNMRVDPDELEKLITLKRPENAS